jgi:hypothetical protein
VARGSLACPAGVGAVGVGAVSKLGWYAFQGVIIGAVFYACYQGAAEHGFEGTTEQRAIAGSLALGIGVAYGLTWALGWLFSRLEARAAHKGLRQSSRPRIRAGSGPGQELISK